MGLDHIDLCRPNLAKIHGPMHGFDESFAILRLADGVSAGLRGRVGAQKACLGVIVWLVLKNGQNGPLAHVKAVVGAVKG